jgi:hypothetical protein
LNFARIELLSTTLVIDLEDPIICPYCGPKNLKPTPTCTLFKIFNNGDFVLVRPHDPFLVLVWFEKTQSDVVKDDQNENFKMVRVMVGAIEEKVKFE